jgi:PAS domain S-box-containing protein
MSENLPGSIRERFGKLPLTMERHGRDILLAGFFLLLLLISSIGYWSEHSLRQLEASTFAAERETLHHFGVAVGIDEIRGEMIPAVSMAIAENQNKPLHFTAMQRLKDLKRQMDHSLDDGSKSSLGTLPEFKEVEDSFDQFWDAVDSDDPLSRNWEDKRDRLTNATQALMRVVGAQREANDAEATQSSDRARRGIGLTTALVLGVGMVVALLTFLELRRILDRLSRAYRESAESRDYLKSLLDSLMSGVIVIADDGLVTIANRAMLEQAGLTGRDPVGLGYRELFADKQALIKVIAERLEGGTPGHRYAGRVQMGDKRLFDIYASPLLVSEQQRGLILVFVDVTDVERAQMELLRNRALSAVGQMTAQVAHEIKNPLGSINLAIDLLRRRPGEKTQDELEVIGVIERSVGYLGQIVSELLEFSRPKELNRSRININKFLDDLLSMVADRSKAKQIDFEKEFSDSIPIAEYDESELRKLFINLIINAIDASDPGKTIELRTKLDGPGSLLVDVEDHGCGMDAETTRRLFEPFYTTKKTGTGLGMAIARKIAELHRGDLSVSSRKGEGTRITVRLPLNDGAGLGTQSGETKPPSP